MTSYRLPPILCPKCGDTLDAHTDAIGSNTRRPSEGDIGICAGCLTPLVFDADLKLREATEADNIKLPKQLERRLRAFKAITEAICKVANDKGTVN